MVVHSTHWHVLEQRFRTLATHTKVAGRRFNGRWELSSAEHSKTSSYLNVSSDLEILLKQAGEAAGVPKKIKSMDFWLDLVEEQVPYHRADSFAGLSDVALASADCTSLLAIDSICKADAGFHFCHTSAEPTDVREFARAVWANPASHVKNRLRWLRLQRHFGRLQELISADIWRYGATFSWESYGTGTACLPRELTQLAACCGREMGCPPEMAPAALWFAFVFEHDWLRKPSADVPSQTGAISATIGLADLVAKCEDVCKAICRFASYSKRVEAGGKRENKSLCGPFANRSRWLRELLIQRHWTAYDLALNGGPARETVEKMLNGFSVRTDVLRSLTKCLSQMDCEIDLSSVPSD